MKGVEGVRLTVIVEDTVDEDGKARGLKPEHGLSILVEIQKPELSLLMDTGRTGDTLLNNMKTLGIDPGRIGVVFLSHGHYDHTGGLKGFLERLDRPIPIIAHPGILDMKLKYDPHLKYIGPPFTRGEVESLGGVMILTRNPLRIMEGVLTTGEVERRTPYERTEGFWTIKDGELIEDHISDDQAIVINLEGKGLIVVSGCAHSGIINMINQARELTGVDEIYAVIGGFHLTGSSGERIRLTVKDLTTLNPRFLYPCHCTGSKAIKAMKEAFNERCKPPKTGDLIVL